MFLLAVTGSVFHGYQEQFDLILCKPCVAGCGQRTGHVSSGTEALLDGCGFASAEALSRVSLAVQHSGIASLLPFMGPCFFAELWVAPEFMMLRSGRWLWSPTVGAMIKPCKGTWLGSPAHLSTSPAPKPFFLF